MSCQAAAEFYREALKVLEKCEDSTDVLDHKKAGRFSVSKSKEDLPRKGLQEFDCLRTAWGGSWPTDARPMFAGVVSCARPVPKVKFPW